MSISVECPNIPLRAPNCGGRILSVGTAPGSLPIGPGLAWDGRLAILLGKPGGGPGTEKGLGFAVLLDITYNYLVISITLSLPPYLSSQPFLGFLKIQFF